MLSRPDDDLVHRDPALPGLRALLDSRAFTDILRGAMPALHAATARAIYVRYKPGTRCLVAYAIEGAADVAHVHANAYSRARWRERSAAASLANDGSDAASHIALDDLAVAVTCFPHDDKLRVLRRLWDPAEREAIVRKLVPGHPALHAGLTETLAYKPGRRYVGLLSGDNARAVLKLYGEGVSASARVADRHLRSSASLRVARCIGRSRRHRALVFEWVAGERVSELLAAGRIDIERLRRVGAALAELHQQLGRSVVDHVPPATHVLSAVARGVAVLCPSLSARAARCAHAAAASAEAFEPARQPIHGDFYAGQVLIGDTDVGILDLDRAALGDPGSDVGNFAAHLEYDVIDGSLSPTTRDAVTEALVGGYEDAAGVTIRDRVRMHTAAGLLRLGMRPFRARATDWDERTAAILDRVDSLLVKPPVPRSASNRDPEAAFPSGALDALVVEGHFARQSRLRTGGRDVRVRAIRVARHKPGRRTLIEYDVEALRHDGGERFTVLGKVRAKGADARTCQLVEALWRAGFRSDSGDGISVPEPLGVVPELKMWLQRKMPGTVAAACLDAGQGPNVCRRAAEVIHKLHRAGVEAQRRHSVDDELRILEQGLLLVGADQPSLRPRLDALFDECRRLAQGLPASRPCGIHRDFHPGQLLLDGDRVYLLDLDLYAAGDPALDVGNFLAHVAEYSLRHFGDPNRLAACEAALVNRFLELAPDVAEDSIERYRTISLARHVQISTLFADRRPFTERILACCESRFGLGAFSTH